MTWHSVLLSYVCIECGSGPGEPCVTKNGNIKNECHAIRSQDVNKCPICGGWTYAEGGPCSGRCEQVRALEVERATYHVRRDDR